MYVFGDILHYSQLNLNWLEVIFCCHVGVIFGFIACFKSKINLPFKIAAKLHTLRQTIVETKSVFTSSVCFKEEAILGFPRVRVYNFSIRTAYAKVCENSVVFACPIRSSNFLIDRQLLGEASVCSCIEIEIEARATNRSD